MTDNQMGGIFRMKREIKKLKAEIRELKEELADSQEKPLEYLDKLIDERQRVKALQAVNKEIGDLAWEAENQLHAAQKAASAVYDPLLNSFLALSKLMTAVSKSTL